MNIFEELEKLRRTHYTCDGDCWFSCPKSEDGCCDEYAGENCNCGAEQYNELLDKIIEYLRKAK